MDEATRFEAERACERLVVDYTHLVDFGEAERVAELFSVVAVWEAGDVRFEGREALRFRGRFLEVHEGRMGRLWPGLQEVLWERAERLSYIDGKPAGAEKGATLQQLLERGEGTAADGGLDGGGENDAADGAASWEDSQ